MLISVVKEYYENAGIVPALLNSKIGKLERHPDVLEEFAEWIKTGSYKETSCVEVEGYTAKSIAAVSSFLDGEGAFMMLIDLREKPALAKKKLANALVIR